MNVVVVYGSERKGSTYHIVQMLLKELGEIKWTEIVLPRDLPEYCRGCTSCCIHGAHTCPHAQKVEVLQQKMVDADVIILSSAVYVYHVTGAMKNFLDHFASRWLVHSPEESMFQKVGVAISTAAGAGMKSTNKDMTDSLNFWGVGKIYTYGKAVAAANWKSVSEEKKKIIKQEVHKLANKIKKQLPKKETSLKTKALFLLFRALQKRKPFSKADEKYWTEKGWLGSKRPWKK